MTDRMTCRKISKRRNNNPSGGDGHRVYRELMDDAIILNPSYTDIDRPLKKPRHKSTTHGTSGSGKIITDDSMSWYVVQDDDATGAAQAMAEAQESFEEDSDDVEAEHVQFEDVPAWSVGHGLPYVQSSPKAIFTGTSSIQLKLDSPEAKSLRRSSPSQVDRQQRLSLHKTHILFLLWHCAQRNHWCNDSEVQHVIRPLLTRRMIGFLNPLPHLSQFDQAESIKTGLLEVGGMFQDKFRLSEKGIRRALWAESNDVLSEFQLPGDIDSCLDKNDFRGTAQTLAGSRDVGAQLYCALLRSAGVQARLVCSLQVLCPGSGGPGLSSILNGRATGATSRTGAMSQGGFDSASRRTTEESTTPIFWVEVLDKGHQKWQPADPIVTQSFWNPRLLEPPASDVYNCLSYVIAFNADGSARDVTRRYASAYTTKTRKQRVEGANAHGATWWRKVMCCFNTIKGYKSDIDQIEDIELAAREAREPMPRNVADFKDHPVYALKRHLRRNEVFVQDATQVGTISAGPRGSLEPIYRRLDVRIAHGKEKWYRLGRVVKPEALINPAKVLPAPPTWHMGPGPASYGSVNIQADKECMNTGQGGRDNLAAISGTDGHGGKSIFTIEQTDIFVPDAVVDGFVPKNKFGNIYVYIPSMVPAGGTHIVGSFAARAALIIGVDFAPAVTGFRFHGRRAAAVFDGVVVAEVYADAVNAVVGGLQYIEVETQQTKRSMDALRMWRRFLVALRIHERIWARVPRDKLPCQRDFRLQSRENEELVGVSAVHNSDSVGPLHAGSNDCGLDDDDIDGGGFMVE